MKVKKNVFYSSIRLISSRPGLFISVIISAITHLILTNYTELYSITRSILAANIGAIFYIILAIHMMFFSKKKTIQERAELHDEGQFVILILVIGAAVLSLVSIVQELSIAKEIQGLHRYEHMALAAITILISWTFTHLMFALHYAHNFYINMTKNQTPGLLFPGDDLPDYADFLYFSFVIGTSAQTADISFSSSKMRKIGLVHCVLSFFFNTTVLALTINIASSLF